MDKIWNVMNLRLKLMLQDKLLFSVTLLFPVVFALILGNTGAFTKQPTTEVALADLDRTVYSSLAVNRFKKMEGIDVNVVSEERARELVKNYDVEAAFIIKKGFEASIQKQNTDAAVELIKNPGSLSYGILGEMLAGETMRLYADTKAADKVVSAYHKYSLDEEPNLWKNAWSYADSFWEPRPLMTLDYQEIKDKDLQETDNQHNFSSASGLGIGMMLLFLMLFVVFHSGWVIEEKNNGTWKRILSAPKMVDSFFWGNLSVLFILSYLQIIIITIVFNVVFKTSLFSTIYDHLILAGYLFAVIGLGMLITAFFKTRARLQASAPLIAILFGFAGGCFWPFIKIPANVELISLLTPQGWALKSLKELMVHHIQPGTIILNLSVLLLSGLAFSLISLQIIKKQMA